MSKNILYIHGFSSSGRSATATALGKLMPDVRIIAPDLPMNPQQVLALLHEICRQQHPCVIIGTSMGGMFAQQLRGFSKILVNPAFHISEFMRLNIGWQPFLNQREDGVQEYEITLALCDAYLAMEQTQFVNIDDREINYTYAVLGSHDPLVNCKKEYLRYYKNVVDFDGQHRLTFEDVRDVIVPLVQKLI
ncbi:MAG: YqiA/YcfP family alpha/beta fold hydrolase [Odoribacter sp.]